MEGFVFFYRNLSKPCWIVWCFISECVVEHVDGSRCVCVAYLPRTHHIPSHTITSGHHEGPPVHPCCARGGTGQGGSVYMQPVCSCQTAEHVEGGGVQVDARGQGAALGRRVGRRVVLRCVRRVCAENTKKHQVVCYLFYVFYPIELH